jgi:hypothetical protein
MHSISETIRFLKNLSPQQHDKLSTCPFCGTKNKIVPFFGVNYPDGMLIAICCKHKFTTQELEASHD